MIIIAILTIAVYLLNIFLGVLENTVGLIPSLPSIPAGAGYIFGNIYLLNDFLPITDLYAILIFAITFKAAILAFKVFLLVIELLNTVRKTFLSLRL